MTRSNPTVGTLLAAALLLAGSPGGTASADHASDHSSASASRLDALSTLQGLGEGLFSSAQDDEFLDPEVAFVLSAAAVEEGEAVRLQWQVAPGYYLYRKRFEFAPVESAGFELGEAQFPSGEIVHDDYFGDAEVYYQSVYAVLPLRGASPDLREARLNVTYQGCADAGLCYPPITKAVSVDLRPVAWTATTVAAGGTEAVTGGLEGELPDQDQVALSLASGSAWAVVLKFLLFGLALTFTPCVLPMIPILSGIIAGQGAEIGSARAFVLSLVYVLAMAAAYTAAGVAAGLSGANLQAAFQDPWILGAFSAVFVALALSMFGFYELQLPSAWQSKLARIGQRQHGGTYVGVAAMGLLSALIVGPCVAAPLAGALIYIAQSGDAGLGGLALFSMAMGMGVPLLVVGTSAGRLLPRAGPWMDAIKCGFGVLLLGVAIYLLERVLPSWVTLLLWASLLIVAAIYVGALDTLGAAANGWRRLWKGTGLVMLVYGVLLMVGAAGGGGDLLQPLRGLRGGAPAPTLEFRPVKGPQELRAELRVAAASGRSVMLDYYADWCVSCKQMERTTFTDPQVHAALASTVLLQTDVTAHDERDRELLRQFGLHGPPAILFFGPDGRERPQYRVVGFMPPQRFRRLIERAVAGPATQVSSALY